MDKKLYRDAEKLMEKEIRDIVERGELDPGSLDVFVKVIDNLKDISIVCAMKKEAEMDEEYAERYASMYENDAAYARGRGRGARRDSRGRYASRYDYDGQYDGQYEGQYEGGRSYDYSGRRGYSRDDELDKMMSEAKTEKERELIRQLKELKM